MCNVHFILTLTPSMTAGQGHEILRFCELFLLTGSSLCSLLLRNYWTDFSNDDTNQLREQCRCATCTSFWPWPPPWLQVKVTKYFDFVNYFLLTGSSLCSLLLRNYWTDSSNDDTNQLREQCRCATCTSFWPWPPPWLQVKVTKYFDFVNYFCWRVVVCVRFSSETTRPISPMMIPINWGNNVDVQHALHFDLDPSMTAGQGHEILRFCELFLLTGSSLCSLLLRNYWTDSSNDNTNQLREQCRCATCTSFWPWPLHDCRSRSRNTSIF